MKKQLILAFALILVSYGALASKARMQALGQDADGGSFYLKDSRNVFRNPSTLSGMSDYLVTEWGSESGSAEGGFFRSSENFSYGLYLGSDVASLNGGIGREEGGFLPRDNEVDFFLAGDMGAEWGVRLGWAGGSAESGMTSKVEQSSSALNVGLGGMMGDLGGYINLTLSNESEGAFLSEGTSDASGKWEGTGMEVGASYRMQEFDFFVNYRSFGVDSKSTFAPATESSGTVLSLGGAHVKRMSSASSMFLDLRYVSESVETKGGSSVEVTDNRLPLTLGFETSANDWLMLRGSVTQRVFLNSRETTVGETSNAMTEPNSTEVQAGATLSFGKLKIDGMIGSEDAGVLALDRLLTQVAFNYSF